MRQILLFLLAFTLIAGCAPSKEQIAQWDRAEEMKKNFNLNLAESIDTICSAPTTDTTSLGTMQTAKDALDKACDYNIEQMTLFYNAWSAPMKLVAGTSATEAFDIAFPMYKDAMVQRGEDVVIKSYYNCVTTLMKLTKSTNNNGTPGFQELLEYYAVYTQTYELAMNPSGSWLSYGQAITDLKSEVLRLSSKLRILLM